MNTPDETVAFRAIKSVLALHIASVGLFAAISCSTTTKPPVTPAPAPPPPPISVSWTNSLRPIPGTMTSGINLYLPAPPSAALEKLLVEAGAIRRPGNRAWTIERLDLNNARQLSALTAVGYAGGHTTPHVRTP